MIKRIVMGVLIMGMGFMLGGCMGAYTKEDMEKYAEERLEKKYGEEFVVCDFINISGTTFQAYAYPKNNPDIIFRISYNVKIKGENEYEMDYYIEELVAAQYKEIAEKSLAGFNYDYYVDIDLGWQRREVPLTDTSITIEEYNEVTEDNYKIPGCHIYMTYDVLSEKDEYIYNYLYNIRESMNCYMGVYIVENEDFKSIINEYNNRSDTHGEVDRMLSNKYSAIGGGERKGYFHYAWLDGGLLTYEEFEEIMKEVREDAGL